MTPTLKERIEKAAERTENEWQVFRREIRLPIDATKAREEFGLIAERAMRWGFRLAIEALRERAWECRQNHNDAGYERANSNADYLERLVDGESAGG